MKFLNKYLAILSVFILTTFIAAAQDSTAVEFSFLQKRVDKEKVILTITARVTKPGVELYPLQKTPDDIVFSQITFDSTSEKYLSGTIDEKAKLQTKTDATLSVPVSFVTDSIQWIQDLTVPEEDTVLIKGKIAYMYKMGEEFPALEKDFSIDIKTSDAAGVASSFIQEENSLNKSSLWELFLAGLVAGFIAFIMPCIYALLPITVGFFTKRSKNRATGVKNAVLYSLSIIFIFSAIGALVSLLFTEKTMYELSTSMGFNLFVFVLFVVFGISLLGAFEITLPASWSTKLDSKANSNSFGGIFFMALVLVVVSFSCTSAFISSLIVYIVKSGNSLGGVVGFLGFGLAIALPFALGAFFPSILNKIAKSGGWLNSVKVTMGFLELAMAMKFLSNVDLQYHWRLLDFEIYLSIWIVIFGLLGFYLLGKLRLSHDDQLPKNSYGLPYLSVTRLFFAIATLSFTVYLIPGLWGAPLSGVSGFLPERKTLDFNLHDNILSIQANAQINGNATSGNNDEVRPVKYTSILKSELPGIAAFFDYEEALIAAKKTGKPVLLDFTGHSCVNCRKMERAVLSKPEVLRELNQHFIVASLYCDDKTLLPQSEQYISKDGSEITTLGAKNLDLELTRFGAVAQPLYIFVNENGEVLKNAGGYEPDVQRFLNIIKDVKEIHNQKMALK